MRNKLVCFCILFFLACQLSIVRSQSDGWVQKSIYPENTKNRSKIYNRLWGKHYRSLYARPISVQTVKLDSLSGGVDIVGQAGDFHGVYLEDKDRNFYMLKPLGGSTSFIESDFFREMYNKRDFRNTYLDNFIRDAYTIINPYTYIASDQMAKSLGLYANNSRLYYLPTGILPDTIADGSRIQDKLITIYDIPDLNTSKHIITTRMMLDSLLVSKKNTVNQELYIRERLFDILIGDWNKIPENWNWLVTHSNDSTIFYPMVVDRNHGFTKVDGFLFKQLLNILTLGFVYNYDEEVKNIKKFNKLGYTLDVAVTAPSNENAWVREATYLQNELSDSVIESAFGQLPEEINGEEIEKIKSNLKIRRDNLQDLAVKYYDILQQNPVLTGTQQDNHFFVDRSDRDSIDIKIYEAQAGEMVFHKKYDKKKTNDIWIYGLGGDDRFVVTGKPGKVHDTYLIGGKGKNDYSFTSGKKVRVYDYKEADNRLDSVHGAKVILSDNDKIQRYDYQKTKYHQSSFTPWGFYDSDLGINLGAFYTYTQYGFKRFPFTYQHRIGFNYLRGFMYRGIFPTYREGKIWIIDATFGFPKNNFNFFGFGNETDGYKDEKRHYNQVNIRDLSIRPTFEMEFGKYHTLSPRATIQLIKVLNPDDRFINTVYDDDDRIFDTRFYADLGIDYQFKKKLSDLFSNFEFGVGGGWKVNLNDVKRNFPYTDARLALNLAFSRRFSWATMMKTNILYNDKYEFFQAATTELRGYRNNRFLGKYSFYDYSDFRFDMGRLDNTFVPLKYGLFAGFDWGRVWLPGEHSNKWHTSYGGGLWLILINKIITKYSLFGSKDTVRFMFELGFGF